MPACAQGITHLLFNGITTDVCVHTTLREAAIHMVMVEDRIFGTIATADAAIAGLSAGDASYSRLRETLNTQPAINICDRILLVENRFPLFREALQSLSRQGGIALTDKKGSQPIS